MIKPARAGYAIQKSEFCKSYNDWSMILFGQDIPIVLLSLNAAGWIYSTQTMTAPAWKYQVWQRTSDAATHFQSEWWSHRIIAMCSSHACVQSTSIVINQPVRSFCSCSVHQHCQAEASSIRMFFFSSRWGHWDWDSDGILCALTVTLGCSRTRKYELVYVADVEDSG